MLLCVRYLGVSVVHRLNLLTAHFVYFIFFYLFIYFFYFLHLLEVPVLMVPSLVHDGDDVYRRHERRGIYYIIHSFHHNYKVISLAA